MSNRRVDPFVPPSPLDETEPEIQELIERGRSLGFLTYQELNTDAPEEAQAVPVAIAACGWCGDGELA